MARRKARNGMKKVQPAVRSMIFEIPPIEGANTWHFIDLGEAASLANRRFYRAGLAWHVAGFTLVSKTGVTGNFKIDRIPETWVACNAWQKGFSAWQKMNNEALDETDSVRPKFLDFKVYMNAQHHNQGSALNLLPEDSDGNVATPGAWDYSKIHVPYATDTTTAGAISMREFDLIWTGESYPGAGASGSDGVSLIEGYAASRGLPNVLDPNTPDDAADSVGGTPQNWITAMFNEGITQSAEVIDDLITENVIAPYPFENDGTNLDTMYPGGANQMPSLENLALCSVTATTIGDITYLPGGLVYGGLLRLYSDLQLTDQSESPGHLVVHLAPGMHRGYDCVPMQDV